MYLQPLFPEEGYMIKKMGKINLMKDLSKLGTWHCCVWTFTLFSYHCVDGLSLPLLQGFPGLFSAPNPFWAQAQ